MRVQIGGRNPTRAEGTRAPLDSASMARHDAAVRGSDTTLAAHRQPEPVVHSVGRAGAALRDTLASTWWAFVAVPAVLTVLDGLSESSMAHGYVVVVGDFTIFIQHTANHVITSDIAQDMVTELAIGWSAKQTSLPEGWSAGISH